MVGAEEKSVDTNHTAVYIARLRQFGDIGSRKTVAPKIAENTSDPR